MKLGRVFCELQHRSVAAKVPECVHVPALRRTAEEVRNFGPNEPPVKGLVQGAYSKAWVDMNLARQVGRQQAGLSCETRQAGVAWHSLM